MITHSFNGNHNPIRPNATSNFVGTYGKIQQTTQWIFLTDKLSCTWTNAERCILHGFLCLYSFLSVRNISQLPLCVESAESDLGVLHALLST